MPLLSKNNPSTVDVDKTVTNKFIWRWREETVQVVFNMGQLANETQPDVLGDVSGQSSQPGYAYCLFCESEINYGTSGKSALIKHVSQKKHIKNYQLRIENKKNSS